MKNLLTLLILFFCYLSSSAQQLILGSVRDGFLKTPLVNARITLMTEDSIVVQDYIKVNLQKRAEERWGRSTFSIKLPKKTCTYLLRASLEGYDNAWQSFTVKAEINEPWGLDSPLELRRSREKNLGEATVTATRLKMYYKGDTLVYDALAFKLPEGSMLDDMIRQMPGVTMNDGGEIFINGRKVDELLLGSRSFMGGNSKVLLENLPYYTVKNVKVYEKESDRNQAVGYEVEKKKYVMDVNLKDTYRNGYIGNLEAAGGTKERWLGRAFLLGYTDKFRFTLWGNANNVNEKRHIGESGNWKPENMPLSELTTKSVAGEVDYQSKNGNVKENFMFDFTASTDEGETVKRQELFIDNSRPFSIWKASSTSQANRIAAKNKITLKIPNKFFADLGVEFVYNKYKGNSESLTENYLNSINTRLQGTNYNNGHAMSVNVGGFVAPRFKSPLFRSLSFFYGFKHNNDKNETAREFITEQFVMPSKVKQYNMNDFRHRETQGNIHLHYGYELSKQLQLEIQDRQEYTKKYERDNLYHPDTLMLPSQLDALLAISDLKNSYVSDYWQYNNTPTLTLKWKKNIPGKYMNLEYMYAALNFINSIRIEHLNYTRNRMTQNKERTTYSFYPSFTFKIHPTKKRGEQIQFHFMYEQSAPSIFDKIDYIDDATPQIVKMGNPKLKGNASSTININFTDWESKRKQQYSLKGKFSYFHRQVAQSVVFNPGNSLYTYQPRNVHGAYQAALLFDYVRSQFGKNKCWSWQTALDASYNHSVDHVMQTGMTESVPNAVNTYIVHDGLSLTYEQRDFSVKASGDIRWRHSEGKMRNFKTLDAFDFQYGIMARYTLPVVKTTLSVDAIMYARRGYGSGSLNTDDFVMNASISQPLFKGRMIVSLEAFDLLHELSATQYAVNAQGRTETWNRTLPNYVMLHLTYRLDRKPKKH